MRCAPWASNDPDHLGLRALQDHPKMINVAMLNENRELGITAIEMGVQTTDDRV